MSGPDARSPASSAAARTAVFAPRFLGPEDHAWLALLLDELQRFSGRPMAEWTARCREPLRVAVPERKLRIAVEALTALCSLEPVPRDPAPSELREKLFRIAQRMREEKENANGVLARDAALAMCSSEVGLDAGEVESRLFADLANERRLIPPEEQPSPHELALRSNFALAQGFLRASTLVEIGLGDRSRALLRQILLQRLLCTVRPDASGVRVEVSGPMALFRRTTMYGRALASILPALRGAEAFEVLAHGDHGGRAARVRLASGDPLFPPGIDPPRFDSRIEERFARDFGRLALDWDLLREPEPIAVDGTWIFPDFALVHRVTGRRFLLEIVGFWTPQYLRTKLDRLRRADRNDLLVCVDASLACTAELPPELRNLLFFRKWVDAAAVQRALGERSAHS